MCAVVSSHAATCDVLVVSERFSAWLLLMFPTGRCAIEIAVCKLAARCIYSFFVCMRACIVELDVLGNRYISALYMCTRICVYLESFVLCNM